jgi:hypothetical protein
MRARNSIPLIAAILSSLIVGASSANARPYRGGVSWAFLLCNFSDSPTPPHDANYYRNMMINSGTNGLDDYVKAISNGVADLSNSSLHGWYTEPHTLSYEQNLSSRWQRVQDCLDTADADKNDPFKPAAGQRIYVITSPGVDLAGWENTAAIGGDGVALAEIAHEFGHGMGLNHSYSNDVTWKDCGGGWCGGPGEYGNPWDVMSAANDYEHSSPSFISAPPDLDAHHLDEMGWLPKSRILTLGVDGILERQVDIAALTHPGASGYLAVRVPFDSKDRFHYYTVEYRTPDSWDVGIPAKIVLSNEILNNSSFYQTTLQRELGSYAGTNSGPPLQTLNANGVSISVVSTASDHATIKVSTQYALPCAQGYVWREASSIDRVCVTPATRTQTAKDNSEAASRHVANSTTCLQGYVWREAYPGDVVCVPPATRAQAKADNDAAYAHVNESLVSYGPNTCQNGYVWRDGDDNDYVCVSPQTRAQAAADNAAASSRHLPGSKTCVQGYVWREAWPGDYVCVTPATRAQAKTDNDQATNRLEKLWAAVEPHQHRHAFALIGRAEAAEQSRLPEATSPAPMTEDVARVRLEKQGYVVHELKRVDDSFAATVEKDGKTQSIRLHAVTGEIVK